MNQQEYTTMSSSYPFEPLLTAEEAARHLRCHIKTVQRYAADGRMHGIKRGRRYFFRLSELDDWLREMHTQPQPTLRVN